eukprot:7379873-Prymnesium_polylepis.2
MLNRLRPARSTMVGRAEPRVPLARALGAQTRHTVGIALAPTWAAVRLFECRSTHSSSAESSPSSSRCS